MAAIFMANNVTTRQWTRHADIGTQFVTQYRENGILKILFVTDMDQKSDIMTKNVKRELHNKYMPKLMEMSNDKIAK